MVDLFGKMTVCCGLAGMLSLSAAALCSLRSSSTRTTAAHTAMSAPTVMPVPTAMFRRTRAMLMCRLNRGRCAWDYPLGYDNTGRPYFRGERGWRPGPPSAAPANPCWEGQRQQNLC